MANSRVATAGSSDRTGDDDYDLLTFGEANIRLTEEIARVEALLSEVTDRGDADSAILAARLLALREAQVRNSPHRIDPQSFREFFGYEPAQRPPR